ncbi:MBL fold metallo-hydrolase [Brucella anthropi]|uniref:MBL fold metallo-hydrolase n=1 Tax=Brucella anthropi TaxID=529 RepID=UPI0006908D24|nr:MULTISPECIES: MBL fold metallo-hydrolase [Brucella/Ochrobactrum group]KAB2788770.1 MBL fold metallo-hydrolase [Brucella anthropi]QOD63221.1 MBL fold metallo-hydrolase [Ochrobactrum sp. MT180101]
MKRFSTTMGSLAILAGLAVAGPAMAQEKASPLQWQYFQADENGFNRTPVLLTGDKDAILLDGGFTLSDGKAVAEKIKETGKKLTTIYVSQSDPDYYFSLGPIKAAFPDARIIAAPETVDAIKGNIEAKLKVWGPQLKDNGPQKLSDVVVPEASDVKALELEGNEIEIVPAEGMTNRRYLWVPSLKAVFGGVLITAGEHVWLADTPDLSQREAWIRNLDTIAARNPEVVVPAHMKPGSATDVSAIKFTRDYIAVFDEEAAKAKDSGELIAAMKKRYPDLGGESSLELGAKVIKGEMKWE